MVTDDRDGPGHVTRREFLVTALAVGFAAAVRPTAAEVALLRGLHDGFGYRFVEL